MWSPIRLLNDNSSCSVYTLTIITLFFRSSPENWEAVGQDVPSRVLSRVLQICALECLEDRVKVPLMRLQSSNTTKPCLYGALKHFIYSIIVRILLCKALLQLRMSRILLAWNEKIERRNSVKNTQLLSLENEETRIGLEGGLRTDPGKRFLQHSND